MIKQDTPYFPRDSNYKDSNRKDTSAKLEPVTEACMQNLMSTPIAILSDKTEEQTQNGEANASATPQANACLSPTNDQNLALFNDQEQFIEANLLAALGHLRAANLIAANYYQEGHSLDTALACIEKSRDHFLTLVTVRLLDAHTNTQNTDKSC